MIFSKCHLIELRKLIAVVKIKICSGSIWKVTYSLFMSSLSLLFWHKELIWVKSITCALKSGAWSFPNQCRHNLLLCLASLSLTGSIIGFLILLLYVNIKKCKGSNLLEAILCLYVAGWKCAFLDSLASVFPCLSTILALGWARWSKSPYVKKKWHAQGLWTGLGGTCSDWRCPCSLQRGWISWPLKVLSNLNCPMTLWKAKKFLSPVQATVHLSNAEAKHRYTGKKWFRFLWKQRAQIELGFS